MFDYNHLQEKCHQLYSLIWHTDIICRQFSCTCQIVSSLCVNCVRCVQVLTTTTTYCFVRCTPPLKPLSNVPFPRPPANICAFITYSSTPGIKLCKHTIFRILISVLIKKNRPPYVLLKDTVRKSFIYTNACMLMSSLLHILALFKTTLCLYIFVSSIIIQN